jgi:hypothetical protein
MTVKSKGQFWTPEDIEFLQQRYPKHGGVFVAQAIGKTEDAVYAMASKLKIPRKVFHHWTPKEDALLKR